MENRKPVDILDHLTGGGTTAISFGQLNMDFTLRVPSFVGTCLSVVTADLNRHFDVLRLRGHGTALILYYFEAEPDVHPLAVSRPLEEAHTATLYRVPAQDRTPEAAGADRLVVDERFDLHGFARQSGINALGIGEGGGRVHAGRARMLQIITRPLAPPGERQVTEVPAELRRLREHAWSGPYPTLTALMAEPEGFSVVDAAPPPGGFAVWGVGNTDINQHVTVTEYLMDMENHFYLLLNLAGLPLREHRITRTRCLFRKPYFPGMRYRVQGRLYRRGDRSRWQGGLYEVDAEGGSAPRPSVFGCYEGEFSQAQG
ncbi:MAG: hypothetical protein HY342_09085 [Candidatus Lambdaproteobacteria bacterium]|nr:hypothetical protein [Candidatus Lambdaproteobacteria bacterium]